ncbi:ATP-binding protein [Streptomyces boninensis]|uniref:ATP-binding protein n=1 Tax=Streptomyces boninensis TaxID=2039455 RepID=UPI003B21E412
MCAHRRAGRAEYTLAQEGSSARWARRLTAAYVTDDSDGDMVAADESDEAALVVSELVTNATVHGRGGCRLRLRRTGKHLTVEVHDSSPRLPKRRPDRAGAEDGRGLTLVELLSHRLSVRVERTGGKTVRAVLAT